MDSAVATSAICGRCKTLKSAAEFHKCKARSNGLQGWCKSCMKDDVRSRGSGAQRKWYVNNRDHVRAYMKQYYQDNLEAKRAYGRQYYAEHEQEYVTRWKQRITDGSYLTASRRDAVAKRRALYMGAFVEDVDRCIVWERDEGMCQICFEPVEIYDMHLDHVVPLVKGGMHSYANTQTACAPCNLKKGAD